MNQNFYQNKIDQYSASENKLNQKITQVQVFRLITFLLLTGCFSLAMVYKDGIYFIGFLPCFIVFGWLIKRNLTLKKERRLIQELLIINKNEQEALNLNFSMFKNGEDLQERKHDYTHDLDIFGEHYIFQCLNRTSSIHGQEKLAYILSNFEDNTETVRNRQIINQELAEKVDFRQKILAKGNIHSSELNSNGLFSWLDKGIEGFNSSTVWLTTLWLVPLLMTIPTTLLIIGMIPFSLFSLFMLIPLGITARKLKLIQLHHKQSSDYLSLLKQHQEQALLIESEKFSSESLINIQSLLANESSIASEEVKKLSQIVQALDNRSNPIFALIMNVLVLWDLQYLFKLKKWINKNATLAPQWFEAVAQIEAYSSLSNFSFNNSNYVYPTITNDTPIEAREVGHPLIPVDSMVTNDFSIDSLQSFTIITGANMAGKSTFLRAVGVNLILAMAGSKVCASSFIFKPLKLYSSMRTADSLSENESYFYAELKRLEVLIQKLKKGDQLFVILDEILKGTNSKDKAEGSKKFVDQLVKFQLAGIIATHDLSLCSLAQNHPQKISNNYFDVEIINDELVFDYKLKEGVCSNMNAAYLMKKTGIISED